MHGKKKTSITVLVENNPGRSDCKYEHGLSFYIETPHHKILMDAGATDAAIENAATMGINLLTLDMIVLSHGHYDHSGGIITAARAAKGEHIFMQRAAADDFYHGDRYIGIGKDILALPNVHLLDGAFRPDDEVYIFSNISGGRAVPQSNFGLMHMVDGELVQDDFEHEQCLVLTRKEGNILLSGCAHNGILNILDRYHEIFGGLPSVVVSGFHMMKDGDYTDEEIRTITDTARELADMEHTTFYTGHCTGLPAFELMKPIMGDRLIQLHSGDVIM